MGMTHSPSGYGSALPMPIPGAAASAGGFPPGSPYMGGMAGSAPYGGVPAYAGSAGSLGGGGGYPGGPGSYGSTGGGFPPSLAGRRSPSPFMQAPSQAPPITSSPYMGASQPGYVPSTSYGGGFTQPYQPGGYAGSGYGQPGYAGAPQVYTVSSREGTTTIPAPAGSTIIIHKDRSRRRSSNGSYGQGLRRVRSADMRYGSGYY